MRIRSTARRSIALVASTALLSGGLATGMFATPAHAALTPEITSVSPTSWDNRSSVTMTLHGSNFAPRDSVVLVPACSVDPLAPAVEPCPPLSGTEVGRITATTIPDSYCPADPSEFLCSADDSMAVTFNLGQAAPGKYRVIVKHASPDNTESNPFSFFTIFAYGGANANSSQTGVGAEAIDPFLGIDCDISNDGCGRDNGLTNGIALDVNGANIAVGARVRFLLPNGDEDTGLEFKPGNPSNPPNKFSTSFDDTGYPSAALIQGMYRYYNETGVANHAKFTPGVHTIQVLNTDGKTTGAQSTFVQPYYADVNAVSPRAIGRGAQNVEVTVTGLGFRQGARLTPQCLDSNGNVSSSAGPATLSGQQSDGTYTVIKAPVSVGSAVAGSCTLGVLNTDGAYFGLEALVIGGAPHVIAISPADTSYAHLGQGARVGCEAGSGAGVTLTGSNFVNTNPLNVVTPDPAKMTKFDFGPGITVTTRDASASSAAVCIEVAPDTATGRRDVRAINPDGGSSVTGQPVICSDPVLELACEPDPRYDDLPLQINVGPKITSIAPSSFTQGANDVPVHVVGTGFEDTIADANVEISSTGMTHRAVIATETTVDLQVTTAANATAGARTLTITNPSDYGRAVCTDCLSIDSLQVLPTSAANTVANQSLALLVTGSDLPPLTSSSTVTLTHQLPLPGQPAISGTNVSATSPTQGSAVFNLTDAAIGKYNITVVLDPAQPTKKASCSGCFTVTGAAVALDATPVSPAKAGQGATDWKLTFKGTGFTKGMQVAIPDVTIHDVTFVNATEFTALADVAPTATTGAKTGTVTGGDGTPRSFSFEVTPAPVANAVTAGAAYGQGAGSAGSPDTTGTPAVSTLPLTATGSGFDETADTQLVLGSDVDVAGEVVTKGDPETGVCPLCLPATDDSVTGKVAVSQSAAQGKRALKLVNPADGGTATMVDAFTVNPGPVITSVANENGQSVLTRDGVKHTISFSGGGFPTPTTDADKAAAFKITEVDGAAIDPAVIKVENLQFTAGKITADITVAASRAFGPVRLAVYNAADKGFGTCTTCVTVASLPGTVPNLALTSGAKSLTATWDAAAANGSSIAGYRLTILAPGSSTPTVVPVGASPRSYTFGNLINGVTYTVGIAAVNGVGTGASTTKTGIAGLPSALSIRVSPTVVTYGTPFVLSGKLSSNGVGIAGKTLILEFVRSVGGSYARTVTTTATGTWYFRTTSPYNVRVRARLVPNDATYRPVVTPYVTETVRVKVIKTSPTTGSKSGYLTTLKITGKAYPNKKGRYAYLYKYTSGRRTLVQRVTISSTSTFAFTTKPGKGKHTYRIFVAATPGNAAGYTKYFAFYRV